MLFSEIIGHDKIKKLLVQSVMDQRVPHAQLFLGASGSANLALALCLSQFIHCSSPLESDSCGVCPSCLKHKNIAHPDMHFAFPVATTTSVKTKPISKKFMSEWRRMLTDNAYFSMYEWLRHIGVENKQGIISVDQSADMVKDLSLKPYESDTQIMLIWMPEKMNIQAANKLLKIIEEPPSKTLFLLVAESDENMLATVLSRTQLLKVPSYSSFEVSVFLEQKGVDKTEAKMIASISDGDISKALHMAKYSEGAGENMMRFIQWMRLCFSALKVKDIDKLVQWSETIAKLGRESQKNFLLFASNSVRDALLKNYGVGQMMKMNVGDQDFTMDKFSPFIHADNCIEIIEELNMAHLHIERNANPKILFLDLSFKIARLLHQKLKQAV